MMQKRVNLLFTCGHAQSVILVGTEEEISDKEKLIVMAPCPKCKADAEAAEHKNCRLVEMPIDQYEAEYPACKRRSVDSTTGTVKVWVPNEKE